MPLPHFIVIGENKCGTTSLYHYLSQHSKILPSFGNGLDYDAEYRQKEIRFFDANFHKGIDWYSRCFPHEPGKISGEASPTYFSKSLCAQRIKHHCPSAKIILILRNPVERTFSNYLHNRQWVPGFRERYGDFRHFLDTMQTQDAHVLERSIYIKSWMAWEPLYKPDEILFLTKETLENQPQLEMQKAFSFLGLENELHDFSQKLRQSERLESLALSEKSALEEFFEPYNKLFFEKTGVRVV